MKAINRRQWLKQAGILSAGALLPDLIFAATKKTNPTILLVSGWQDVNIGDIGHTPGLLNVFQTFVPKANIILWKRSNGEEVKKLLNANFPKVQILYGGVTANKDAVNPEVAEAMKKADIMVHGSGPLLVGEDNLASWIKHTNKPFGVFGTTLERPGVAHQAILKKAAFIYTRETHSIYHLKRAGIEGNHIQFAPDATFYINIRNDQRANAFLAENKF